jgi:hypothetical protein
VEIRSGIAMSISTRCHLQCVRISILIHMCRIIFKLNVYSNYQIHNYYHSL